MIPIEFDEANSTLGAPPGMEDDCKALPLYRSAPSKYPLMVSCWELTEEEIKRVAKTGRIYLGIFHNQHPMVLLDTINIAKIDKDK